MFPIVLLSTADSEGIDKQEVEGKTQNKNTARKKSASRRHQARAAQATWGKGQVRLGRILICFAAFLESIFWISCCFSSNPSLTHYAYVRADHTSETDIVKTFEGIRDHQCQHQYQQTTQEYLDYSYLLKLQRLLGTWSDTQLREKSPLVEQHSLQHEDLALLGEGVPGPWLGVEAIH